MRKIRSLVYRKPNLWSTFRLQQKIGYYRNLFQQSSMLVLIWHWNGENFILVEYNNNMKAFLGNECKEYNGIKLQDYFYDELELMNNMKQCLQSGEAMEKEAICRFRGIDHSDWVTTKMIAIFPSRVAIYIESLKEKTLMEKLQRALYQISETASSCRDLNGLYRAVHGIIGKLIPAENFFIALHDEQAGRIDFPYRVDQCDAAVRSRPAKRGLTEYVIRTGKSIFVTPDIHQQLVAQGEVITSGTPSNDWLGVPLKMANNKIFGVMAVQTYNEGTRYTEQDRDILTFVSNQVAMAIERKQAEEQLRFLSRHDALTGLYNRGYLEEKLNDLKGNLHQPITIVVADVDGLKIVNDTLGHKAGDELLNAVAQILLRSVPEGDVTARMGGDEFAIISLGTGALSGEAVCEKIRIQMAKYNKEQALVPISISLGFAVATNENVPLQEVLQQADNYMYQQKMQQSGWAHNEIRLAIATLLKNRDATAKI